MSILGIGTDVLDEIRIVRLVERGSDRFLRHWYTAAEIEQCRLSHRPGRTAARGFAVKEAALKAIGATFVGPVRWSDIEVLTDSHDVLRVRLDGEVEACADRRGVRTLHASTAHSTGWIAAVVVAEG